DFAWIIPVPSRPKIERSSDELFTSLNDLTKIERDWERPVPLINGGRILKNESSPVIVWETKKVEYYDLAVLSANDSHSLVNWLNQNGYHYPKEYDYILNDYIKNNWFFVAAKIDLNVAQNQDINQQIKTGHLIPLKISFPTSRIVYPLRISSIQTKIKHDQQNRYFYYPSNAGILIYIFAQHKQTLPKFDTLYANWIKADKIKNLAYDNQGNPWIKTKNQKYYLTKLYRRMNFSEMTYDLYPRLASNDQVVPYVPNVSHSSWKFYWLLTISGLLILVFLGWMGYEFKKNK
ncbi:MAG TPA: DUF2330 domain-containing protein, partial [Candidatus Portnoybacteria bacterium]|nr:DUF2330 domain-containing protein [Candidatus Portnoybacteria bacterium]